MPPEALAARQEDLERLQGELTALEDRQRQASEQLHDGLSRDTGERLSAQAKDLEALRGEYERQQQEGLRQEERLRTLVEELERLRREDAEGTSALETRIEELRSQGEKTDAELKQAVQRQGDLVREMLEKNVFPRIAEMDQERWARQETETERLREEMAAVRAAAEDRSPGDDSPVDGSTVDALREEIAGLREGLAKSDASQRERVAAETEERNRGIGGIDSRLKVFEGRFLPPGQVFPFPVSEARRLLTTGIRVGLYALVILAFLAIPLLGVQRSTCGEDQQWSFGIPFKDPGAGCSKRQSGAEVIADAIA